jgi:hypothetical protein
MRIVERRSPRDLRCKRKYSLLIIEKTPAALVRKSIS